MALAAAIWTIAGVGGGSELGFGKGVKVGAGDAVSVGPNACGAPAGAVCFGAAAGAGALTTGAFAGAFVAGVVPAFALATAGGLDGGEPVPTAPWRFLMARSTAPAFGVTVGRGV